MDTLNDLVSSNYVIRRRLAELKRAPHQRHYEYYVNRRFKVVIWTNDVRDHVYDLDDNISKHPILESVDLYEVSKSDKQLYDHVVMGKDTRFTSYEPIKYALNPGTPYEVKACTGTKMPLENLCELIRYLYKLDKLSAFL